MKHSLNDFSDERLDKIFGDIYDYSEEFDFYYGLSDDALLEGINSCQYFLNNPETDDEYTNQDVLLDIIWCSMLLLNREINKDDGLRE